MLKQYQLFKANTYGFLEITFTEYKDRVCPLRTKTWTDAERAYVDHLVENEAGYALKCFLGKDKEPQLCNAAPPAIDKQTLMAHLHALVKNCKAACWTHSEYSRYLAYLGSTRTVAEEQTARKLHDLANQRHDETEREPAETIEEDRLATIFRTGNRAIQACVVDAITKAATEAATEAKNEHDGRAAHTEHGSHAGRADGADSADQ
jgi:hypothetical protein